MIRRFVHTAACIAAWVVLAATSLPVAPLAAQGRPKQSPGVEFDMKTTMAVGGGMVGMLPGLTPGYSGRGIVLGNRMRIDIVDGAMPPLAEKGDYILFDTSGMTVVSPSKKEFVPIPKGFSSKAIEQIQAMGMTITIAGISVTFDSLPGTDTVAGYPTRHYRSTVSYTMSMDGMGQSQQMKSQGTSEYWMAQIPALASSPLLLTNQLSGGQGIGAGASTGPLKELAAKTDSVMHRMSGIAVRTKTTTNSDTGNGAMSIDIGAELSNVKSSPISESLFVVPSDYTKGASPFPSHH
jgi:hypothetical protein